MSSAGKMMIVSGVVLILLGLVFVYGHRIPFIGKLPGDIRVERRNVQVVFPIMTCIVVSVIITLILNLLRRK